MSEIESEFEHLNVYYYASRTVEEELDKNTQSVKPFFIATIAVMVAFSAITCMMCDWVKSKPYLGLLGVVSSMLGTGAAFGFLMYLGVPYIGINVAAPFLMLGE
jgi:predicted RND superfamily exporter protein